LPVESLDFWKLEIGMMEEWKNEKMEKWKNGKMEEWKNGRMEEWNDGGPQNNM
jgi:hypothetical protein